MAPPTAPSGGNFLTRKIGPLPTWGWAAIIVGAYVVYRRYKAGQAAAAGSSTTTGPSTGAAAVPGYGTTGGGYTGGAAGPGQEPTATVGFPSGGSYSGPVSGLSPGLQSVLTGPGISGFTGGTPDSGSQAPPTTMFQPVTSPNLTPASAFAQFGQGYGSYPGQQVVTSAGSFYPIGSQAQAAGLVQAGQPVYYFPIPGLAQPVTPGISGVPEYGKVQP